MAQCGNVGKAQRTKVSGGFNGLIILRGAQFMKSFDTGCSQTEVIAVVVAGEGTGSMKPDGNRVKLFVYLLAEGADVWRPTEAVPIGDGLFKFFQHRTMTRKTRFGNFLQAQLSDARHVKIIQVSISSR